MEPKTPIAGHCNLTVRLPTYGERLQAPFVVVDKVMLAKAEALAGESVTNVAESRKTRVVRYYDYSELMRKAGEIALSDALDSDNHSLAFVPGCATCEFVKSLPCD